MATYVYSKLQEEYRNCIKPSVRVLVGEKDLSTCKENVVVGDVDIELSSGFEASVATLGIYHVFRDNGFIVEEIKSFIQLGSPIAIELGYESVYRAVFTGYISKVGFVYDQSDHPCIQLTCMDAKGLMMSGHYAKQLKASTYCDAVKEILEKTAYQTLKESKAITGIAVENTPDKKNAAPSGGAQKETAITVEMVNESDYDFIVKAAKRYNYEFFVQDGTVIFRKAKSNTDLLIELDPSCNLRKYEIEYDTSGLVGKVTARGMDAGSGKIWKATQKADNKISIGGKAKKLIKDNEYVFTDASINSEEDAKFRATSVLEDISYRFGSMQLEMMGLPEIIPGCFIKLSGLGNPPDNTFYLTAVRHVIHPEVGYVTRMTGKACKLDDGMGAGGLGGGSLGGLF